MKLSSVKPAENLYWGGGGLLSFWALDKHVRMLYCHQSSLMFLREYGDVLNIHLWSILCLLLTEWFLVSYLLSLSVGLEGKIIIFWWQCGVTLWILSSFRFEPWLFICITWDSPWYLVTISGWYQNVWCILYTNDVIPGTLCVYYQDQLMLPVLLCYQWAVEGWVVSPFLPLAIALPGEAVSIRYFCWQNYTVNFL